MLFTRLLTDDGGRLLDVTELGRSASRQPRGPTSDTNEDPACRRHHRGKTFAWIASRRDHDTVCWTLPGDHTYRVTDDPLPTGLDPPSAT